VGRLAAQNTPGDGDPLDICVLSERPINRAEVILNARVVGGFPGIDHGEADDKIIAVLDKDYVWGHAEDIADLPQVLIESLSHYFSTYKMIPGEPSHMSVERIYGRDHALKVVEASLADHDEHFGSP